LAEEPLRGWLGLEGWRRLRRLGGAGRPL